MAGIIIFLILIICLIKYIANTVSSWIYAVKHDEDTFIDSSGKTRRTINGHRILPGSDEDYYFDYDVVTKERFNVHPSPAKQKKDAIARNLEKREKTKNNSISLHRVIYMHYNLNESYRTYRVYDDLETFKDSNRLYRAYGNPIGIEIYPDLTTYEDTSRGETIIEKTCRLNNWALKEGDMTKEFAREHMFPLSKEEYMEYVFKFHEWCSEQCRLKGLEDNWKWKEEMSITKK